MLFRYSIYSHPYKGGAGGGSLIVAKFSMFIHVQSFVLNTGRHPKAVELLDAIEEKEAAGCSPAVDDEDAEAFCPKEAPAVAIESSVACREKTCHQRAEDATDTMNGAGTDRVIDMQHMVDELDGKD